MKIKFLTIFSVLVLVVIFVSCTGKASSVKKTKPANESETATLAPTAFVTLTPTAEPTELPTDEPKATPRLKIIPTAEMLERRVTTEVPDETPEPTLAPGEEYLAALSTGPLPGCTKTGYWFTARGTRSMNEIGDDIAVYTYDCSQELKEMMKSYNVIDRGSATEKRIYLTFTMGHSNEYVEKIIDLLYKEDVTAAFFVNGGYYNDFKTNVLKKAYELGFLIGGHGHWHDFMPQTSIKRAQSNITNNAEMLKKYIGESYEMEYFRPPYGYTCERDLAIARDLGIKTVFWTFAYNDYSENGPKKAAALELMKAAVYPGSVFYLHATSDVSYSCLADLITYVRAMGYEFGDIREII